MKLPVAPYLTHIDEEDRAVGMLQGDLLCPCGGRHFRVAHDGKRRHALLGGWWDFWLCDAKRIESRCASCGARMLLHDETGSWELPPPNELAEFVHPRLHDQRGRLRIGYQWDDAEEPFTLDDTDYSSFFIDLKSDETRKPIALFEYEG